MTSVVGRLRRANGILTTVLAFFAARLGTVLMVAYVDEFRDRFRAGIGRDRPRPGDERHAGTGNPRRAPRRDVRHRQTGEGRGRRARPRGTRVRGGGAEPAAPVLGLQDTGTDRNRVLREPSGASRLTIRAEQKTGHINVPDGTFAPPLVRLCGPVVSACRRTAPGRSRRRTRGSQPDARPSATASGRSSPG